ncbi:hypothetical protein [Rikenella microfusus]|uniref:hypothetical protein n=1 Tax=Rikenella microfusus TaxID=28139 RepID=UPI00248D69DF|nr:hypothetical protein [Rikenella microfusus]
MDSVLLLLTLLAVVKTVLTDSLLPRRWQGLSFGLLCAGFVWLCHPYAMEINKLQVENALSEQKALMNISLAVMLDLLLTFGTCWARIVPLRKTRWLRYMPSLLIFPALFYLQINLFFTFAGTSFTAVSVWLAVGIFVTLAGGYFAARALLPSDEGRIELTLLTGMLIFALTICCTVFHPSAAVVSHSAPVDWRSMGLALSVVAVLFAAGYFAPRILKKLKKQHN